MSILRNPQPEAQRYKRILLREAQDNMAEEVRKALTANPKWLPCKYFYDAQGMALFNQICTLPEYYLTRIESDLLRQHAAALIDLCPNPLSLVELGSGSSVKTPYLLEPCLARQRDLTYYALDISPTALEEGARPLLRVYETLKVVGLAGEFADGLHYLGKHKQEPRLVAFLGSTIGNFNAEEAARFFTMLRQELRPQDRFLLGADLLKDPAILRAAYNDAQGVTAQFNMNLLARLNRELGADFDLTAFRHRAIFNPRHSRIEIHLESLRDQKVWIEALHQGFTFRAEETIYTENCYKHSQGALRSLLARHGFTVVDLATDPKDWYGLFLVC
jgi:dimethylhistidine N-methyltransferase